MHGGAFIFVCSARLGSFLVTYYYLLTTLAYVAMAGYLYKIHFISGDK